MRTEQSKLDNRAARWASAGLLFALLAGCGGVYDPVTYLRQVGATVGINSTTDDAQVAFDKGDYGRAEDRANQALKDNSTDVYAIYVLAQVYQDTSRPELARKEYETLVSMNSQQTVVVGSGDSAKRLPLVEVAKTRLAALTPQPPAQMAPAQPPSVTIDDNIGGPEGAIIRRFKTLQRLLNEGLITREEFDQRRAANLGALLPYVAPAPAAGLDVAAPAPSEVADRLKALVSAYQGGSISAIQQQTERTIILDNLLPGPAAKRADPPKPIAGSVQAAEVVGRLTRYREAGIISAEEETKAKAAVMKALQAYEDKLAAAQRMAMGGKPTGEGVRLATYGSEEHAQQGWAAMQKQFPDLLGSLQPVIIKIKLRRGGSVWRLSAGPVADRRAALVICREITRHREACTPTVLK